MSTRELKPSTRGEGVTVPYYQLSFQEENKEEFTEEMEIEITDRMNRLITVSDFLREECVNDVEYICDARYKVTDSQKKIVDCLLAKMGVMKLFLEIWNRYFEMDFLNNDNRSLKTLMNGILYLLSNSMANSTELCVEVFESDLHKVVLNYLKTDYLNPSRTVHADCEDVVYGLLVILHNMRQKIPESSQSLREQQAFDLLQRFRRSPSNKIACMALILQGYIITEEENESVNSDDSNFRFLRDVLERALMPNNHRRRSDGFAPIEVISALNHLAVNDNNKTIIVRVGLLPFYVMLLQPECSEEEQEAAAEGLWTLAFMCTYEIENEPGCVDALKKMAEGNSERLKRLAEGVLWTLGQSETTKALICEVSSTRSGHEEECKGHVFISYQWDSQPMIKKLVSSLKTAGFRVWVDFNNMAGSILEAMANAVEEAAVVIVCLSQKYKESPNCRTEAEYTFRKRKEILPLRLQSGYWPDGWLGAMIGNRLMHDFTSEGKYLESIENVIRELGVRGKPTENEGNEFIQNTSNEPDSKVDANQSVTETSVPTTGSSRGRISIYATWTSAERMQWLQENNLEVFQDWLRDFDGALLNEYKAMLVYTPDIFYSTLGKRFPLKDILKLSRALKQL